MQCTDGISAGQLEQLHRRDPAIHAFAAWDAAAEPGRVHFVECQERGVHRAYLLVWLGDPALPYVHWVGSATPGALLAERLPPRPLIVLAPPEAEAAVVAARGPGQSQAIWLMQRPRTLPLDGRPGRPVARRLVPADLPEVHGLADRNPASFAEGYRGADLQRARVFGVFDDRRLVALGRTQAEPPEVWVAGGIFTEPAARGRGAGTAVTAGLIAAAAAHEADLALYVRADNAPALSVYATLGFRRVVERRWIRLGADREA